LEKAAVWNDGISLHYTITKSQKSPSLSGTIGQLESSLLNAVNSNATEGIMSAEQKYLRKVVRSKMALAVTVHSADAIASLLRVKLDIEQAMKDQKSTVSSIRLIIIGAAESWMMADSLAGAGVGVVLAPSFAFGETWDQRRSLTGAPLTNGTAIDILHAAGVKVAIGTNEDWETRNLFLSAGIAYANGGGKINEKDALAFVSSNIYDMLGLKQEKDRSSREFVVFDGNPLRIDGHVRAVADGRGKVTVWT
jgi:imidazolonepropionase-like amidohydrolase